MVDDSGEIVGIPARKPMQYRIETDELVQNKPMNHSTYEQTQKQTTLTK